MTNKSKQKMKKMNFLSQPRVRVRKQTIEKKNENILSVTRGVYDPNIFKAFFMAGGPGSGKSYAVQLGIGQSQKEVKLTAQGLRVVNSDDVFEKYLKDAKLDFKINRHNGSR